MSEEELKAHEAGEGVGSPEEAGETTAADMLSVPKDTRPVGAGTLAKVEGTESAEGDAEEG